MIPAQIFDPTFGIDRPPNEHPRRCSKCAETITTDLPLQVDAIVPNGEGVVRRFVYCRTCEAPIYKILEEAAKAQGRAI